VVRSVVKAEQEGVKVIGLGNPNPNPNPNPNLNPNRNPNLNLHEVDLSSQGQQCSLFYGCVSS
jgi:hypothetical protein